MTVISPRTPKGGSLPLTGNQPELINVRTPTVPTGVGEYGPVSPGSPLVPVTPSPGISLGAIPGLFFPGVSGGGVPVSVPFMPPNGFAGFAQQTAAVQSLYRRGRAGATGRRRKKKSTKSASSPKRRTKKKRAVAGKLKKGSAAARAYMAKIRKKRKK